MPNESPEPTPAGVLAHLLTTIPEVVRQICDRSISNERLKELQHSQDRDYILWQLDNYPGRYLAPPADYIQHIQWSKCDDALWHAYAPIFTAEDGESSLAASFTFHHEGATWRLVLEDVNVF